MAGAVAGRSRANRDLFVRTCGARRTQPDGPAGPEGRRGDPGGRAEADHAPPGPCDARGAALRLDLQQGPARSEEHTSELQSLMRISYADFCMKKTIIEDTVTNT